MGETQGRNICTICGGLIQVEYTLTFNQCRPLSMRVKPTPLSPFYFCPGHEARRTDSDDWEKLSAEQKYATDQFRKRISDYLMEQGEIFSQEHPDLRLTWSCTIDALIMPVQMEEL